MVLEIAQAPTRLGRYEIERELGRGAVGIVYLGHDPHTARPLAIKTLNYAHLDGTERESVKTRFFRVAEAAGRLKHPGIVTVYDVGEEPDLAYIGIGYIAGVPLRGHVSGGKCLAISQVDELWRQVAEGRAS